MLGNFLSYLLICTIAMTLWQYSLSGERWTVALGLIIVPLTGLIDFQSYLARAYKSIFWAIAPKDILWRLTSIAILYVLFARSGEVSTNVVLATLISVLIALILLQKTIIKKRYLNFSFGKLPKANTRTHSPEAWRESRFPLWVTSVSAIAFTNIDVVVAGLLIGPETAALYFAANRISLVPLLFITSINVVIAPLFSGHFAAGRKHELRETAYNATIQVTFPMIVVVTCLLLLSPYVLGLFGENFSKARELLNILVVATLANAIFGPNDLLLAMCGEEKASMRNGLISLAFGSIAIGIGATTGSAVNIAYCVAISITFARLISWISVRNRLGFSPDILSSLNFYFRQNGASRGRTD